jgi:hypothetical protein
MLLEKARAKVAGSYAKMLKDPTTPKDIFSQLTFAPTDVIETPKNLEQ